MDRSEYERQYRRSLAEPDAFWGPAVHWNTHLQQYVMLLNRAFDPRWAQEDLLHLGSAPFFF